MRCCTCRQFVLGKQKQISGPTKTNHRNNASPSELTLNDNGISINSFSNPQGVGAT